MTGACVLKQSSHTNFGAADAGFDSFEGLSERISPGLSLAYKGNRHVLRFSLVIPGNSGNSNDSGDSNVCDSVSGVVLIQIPVFHTHRLANVDFIL